MPFYTENAIILPRQARDKHRESTQKQCTLQPFLSYQVNGMITFLDDSVGNVTAALKATGLWANTLLVYSPDNGGYLGSGGDDTPLRGGKFSDFQGTLSLYYTCPTPLLHPTGVCICFSVFLAYLPIVFCVLRFACCVLCFAFCVLCFVLWFMFVLFCSVLFCSVLFCSVLFW
jgi:hypothetical protein